MRSSFSGVAAAIAVGHPAGPHFRRWIEDQIQMTPRPAGGVYVPISAERGAVVALLDSMGDRGQQAGAGP